MERPVIGIMGNTYMTQPGMFDSMERAYQNSYYVDAVMKNGGIPVILPASAVMEQTEEIMGICDRVLVMCQHRIRAEFNRDTFSEQALLAAALPDGQGASNAA